MYIAYMYVTTINKKEDANYERQQGVVLRMKGEGEKGRENDSYRTNK